MVEGEYVEFSVSNTASGDHKFQAADVRGVKGGKLFCETRNEQRVSVSGSGDRSLRGGRDDGGDRPVRGRQSGRGGARGGRGGGGEWMLIRKGSSEYRGSGRVYSSRPSGERQPRDSSLSESFVEHSQPKVATAPVPVEATTSTPNEVPATPRAASARKPKQSKPSS